MSAQSLHSRTSLDTTTGRPRSELINHPQGVETLSNPGPVSTGATTVNSYEGAPDDATHAPMTVITDPDAKPKKMPFMEQAKGYAKIYAGKAFGNMNEVAEGEARLADQLPERLK